MKRAIPVQPVKPIIIITIKMEGLAMATTEMIRKSVGMDTIISINREITISMGIFILTAKKGTSFVMRAKKLAANINTIMINKLIKNSKKNLPNEMAMASDRI